MPTKSKGAGVHLTYMAVHRHATIDLTVEGLATGQQTLSLVRLSSSAWCATASASALLTTTSVSSTVQAAVTLKLYRAPTELLQDVQLGTYIGMSSSMPLSPVIVTELPPGEYVVVLEAENRSDAAMTVTGVLDFTAIAAW